MLVGQQVDEINIGVSDDGIILLAMLDASLVFMRATGWMLVVPFFWFLTSVKELTNFN